LLPALTGSTKGNRFGALVIRSCDKRRQPHLHSERDLVGLGLVHDVGLHHATAVEVDHS
jgi:hypothetical protein